MIENFIQHINQKHLLTPDKTYLLACSGGLDSICLGTLLILAGVNFEIAHINFGLRGQESDQDEAFVRNWAETTKKKIHVIHPDTHRIAKHRHVSIQMAAREIRYEWFELIREKNQLEGIILGHHADDQIETIFLNLLRGTGIDGIYGMADRRDQLIRPLLPFSKSKIYAFASQKNLTWREDSSNFKSDYKRNKLRNQVLPALYEMTDDAKSSLKTSFLRLQDAGKAFTALARQWQDQHIREEDGLYLLPVFSLVNMPGAGSLLFNWLRSFGFKSSQIEDILASSYRNETGSIFESSTHLLNLDRNFLILGEKSLESQPVILTLEDKSLQTETENFSITTLFGTTFLDKNPHHAMLDLDLLHFPLVIRSWQEGDRFIPLGMKTRKKISDFLIDLKIPLLKKKKIKVLESEGQIAWIIGLRIAEWAKCTAATKNIFYIKKIN